MNNAEEGSRTYVKVTPMVRKVTARYLSLQFMNAKAMTKIAGNRLPSRLNSFLVRVLVRICFRMSMSATTPEMLIFSQKMMYGNEERKPF